MALPVTWVILGGDADEQTDFPFACKQRANVPQLPRCTRTGDLLLWFVKDAAMQTRRREERRQAYSFDLHF